MGWLWDLACRWDVDPDLIVALAAALGVLAAVVLLRKVRDA